VFSNKIDAYTPIKDDKLKSQNNQNFNFEGEGFSSMLDDEEISGKLRETQRELDEDESILSTDDENQTVAKNRSGAKSDTAEKSQLPKVVADESRMLKLMEMSTKVNMSAIKISKSKKELENMSGSTCEGEPSEELSVLVSKIMSEAKGGDSSEDTALKTSIDLGTNEEEVFEPKKKDNDDVLHETQDELLEDLSILSTDEENLAMVNPKTEHKQLTSDDFSHNGEEDMDLLTELTSIHNQARVEARPENKVKVAESILAQAIEESKSKIRRIDLSNITGEDVDYITDLLKQGTADSSGLMNDNSEKASVLSEKFLAMLKDSILNKKIFRIDFDNEISVIIKIDGEGKISANFLTSSKELEEGLKNNLYLLRQKFEEQNINYGNLEYTPISEDSVPELDMAEVLNTIKMANAHREKTTHE